MATGLPAGGRIDDSETMEMHSKLRLTSIEEVQRKYIASLEEKIRMLKCKSPDDSDPNATATGLKIPEPFINRFEPDRWRSIKPKLELVPDKGTLLVCFKPATYRDAYEGYCKAHLVAINSDNLLKILANLICATLTRSKNVLVYPFKHLIVNEGRIRQAAVEAEENYLKAIKEKEENVDADPEEEVKSSKTVALATLKQTRDELNCVLEFMDFDMRDIFEIRRKTRQGTLRNIAFEYLWQLFEPGDTVVSNSNFFGNQVSQAYTVMHVTGGRTSLDPANRLGSHELQRYRPIETSDDTRNIALLHNRSPITPLILDCLFADCDGQQIGPKACRFCISPYIGERPIVSLEVYPAKFDPNHDKLMKQLLDRGRRFLSVANGSYTRYSGMSIREANSKNSYYELFKNVPKIRAEEVHGEAMIDQAAGMNHFQNTIAWSFEFGGRLLAAPTVADIRESFSVLSEEEKTDCWVTDVLDDSILDIDRRTSFLSSTDVVQYHALNISEISEAQLRLLPNRIYGYAMRNRRWLALRVDLICEINGSLEYQSLLRTRYEDLVLPPGHKKLLQALVAFYTREKEINPLPFDTSHFPMDIVHGKGEGLIILLHGPPGVGKTSTAECVAAQLNRPLLSITCGDLGSSPKELEQNLDEFCSLAHKWRCVLLLDEADVFLSKREKGDVERNARVGVLLRVLEYYSGVLILTSNRVGGIDEAFRSRLHICLSYPKLEKGSVAAVWEKNINHVKNSEMKINIEENEIRHFYELLWLKNEKNPSRQWNGRQIKNAFQTAIALAHWEFNSLPENSRPASPVLRAKHFKRVGKTSAHFDDYIATVYGIEEQDAYGVLAAREEVRRDIGPLPSFMGSKEDHVLYGTRDKNTPFRRTFQENFASGRTRNKFNKVDIYDEDTENEEDEDEENENRGDDRDSEDDDSDDLRSLRKRSKQNRKI